MESIAEMTKKNDRSKEKRQKKKIDELNKELKKMELRPCKGNAELEQKEKDIELLKDKINKLKLDLDRHKYTLWEKY